MIVAENVVGEYPGENVRREMSQMELSGEGGNVRIPMQDYKSQHIAADLCISG